MYTLKVFWQTLLWTCYTRIFSPPSFLYPKWSLQLLPRETVSFRESGVESSRSLSPSLLSSLAVVVFRMQNIQTQTDHNSLSLPWSLRALAESPYLWATKLGGKRKKVSVSSRLCHRVRLISCPALYVRGMSSEYSHLNQKYVSSMTTWGTILFMGVSCSAPCRFCKKQMLNWSEQKLLILWDGSALPYCPVLTLLPLFLPMQPAVYWWNGVRKVKILYGILAPLWRNWN